MGRIVADADFALYVGDALEVLPTLGPVDAIVTSPPYRDARDDVGYGSDLDYGTWSSVWLAHAFQVIRPTGSLMLNLGRLHRDGEELDYWVDVLARARAAGWKWLDTIMWHKVNGGGGRRTPYLIDRHEYVLWLGASITAYRGYDEARQPYSPATLARYTRRSLARGAVAKNVDGDARDSRVPHPEGAKPSSVFTCSVGAEKGIEHPTPMAPELAEHLIRLSCPPGGLVLDPFAGSGTTSVAARRLGRSSVAIELDPAYAAECARRLGQQSLLAAHGS